jgi:hypothetical protein
MDKIKLAVKKQVLIGGNWGGVSAQDKEYFKGNRKKIRLENLYTKI